MTDNDFDRSTKERLDVLVLGLAGTTERLEALEELTKELTDNLPIIHADTEKRLQSLERRGEEHLKTWYDHGLAHGDVLMRLEALEGAHKNERKDDIVALRFADGEARITALDKTCDQLRADLTLLEVALKCKERNDAK